MVTVRLRMVAVRRLYPTSDGIATIKPATVVSSAPATPGASAVKSDLPAAAMPQKASMTPQTVPKRPQKGLTLTRVASRPIRVSSSWIWPETSRSSTASMALYWASESLTGRVLIPAANCWFCASLS